MNTTHLILVADDEAHIRSVVCAKLHSAGFATIEARDGEEALAAVRSCRPSLLITDLQMPYMTGLELCQALHDNPATAGIPVLMLTARGYRLEPADLARTSIQRVISKPFSARELLEQAKELLTPAARDRAA